LYLVQAVVEHARLDHRGVIEVLDPETDRAGRHVLRRTEEQEPHLVREHGLGWAGDLLGDVDRVRDDPCEEEDLPIRSGGPSGRYSGARRSRSGTSFENMAWDWKVICWPT